MNLTVTPCPQTDWPAVITTVFAGDALLLSRWHVAAPCAQGLNMVLANRRLGGPLGADVNYMKPGADFNNLSTTPAGDCPSPTY